MSRREIFRGKKFSLQTVPVSTRSGSEQRALVVHPGSVVILALTDQQEIVFIQNHRYSLERRLLELPAGTRDPEEDPVDCARRELREETGFTAGSLTPLGRWYTAPGFCDEEMFAYLAQKLQHVGQELEDDEDIEVVLTPLKTARAELQAGIYEDGKTIAALGLYLLRERSRSENTAGPGPGNTPD